MHSSLPKFALLAGTALTLGALAACGTDYLREEVADRIARPAFMVDRTVAANDFEITVWERMHQRGAPATVYIEGDGLNWLSPTSPSLDPTPTTPVALQLATMDKSDNVGYIARPCQYSKMVDDETPCDMKYWTGSRYAPEVVDAIGKTLNNMKAMYGISSFNLVGFSGGGNIAAILAATRDDVESLRTVAANLDHETHSLYHEVSPLAGSLNAVDFADQLGSVPQRHFIGGQDEIVPPAILHSYLQAVGETNCVHYTFVQEAEHDTGWVEKWPDLLKEPAECTGPVMDVSFDYGDNAGVFMPRPMPSKP